jgi:hypothetical protein
MGVWQGVAMDSLKFHPGPPCPTSINPAARPLLKGPAAVFYPFGHPTPHVYVDIDAVQVLSENEFHLQPLVCTEEKTEENEHQRSNDGECFDKAPPG